MIPAEQGRLGPEADVHAVRCTACGQSTSAVLQSADGAGPRCAACLNERIDALARLAAKYPSRFPRHRGANRKRRTGDA